MNGESKSVERFSLASITVPIFPTRVPEVSIAANCELQFIKDEISDPAAEMDLLTEWDGAGAKRIRYYDLNVGTGQFMVTHPPRASARVRAENLCSVFGRIATLLAAQRASERWHISEPSAGTWAGSRLVCAKLATIAYVAIRILYGKRESTSATRAIYTVPNHSQDYWAVWLGLFGLYASTPEKGQNSLGFVRTVSSSRSVSLLFHPFWCAGYMRAAMDRFFSREHSWTSWSCTGMSGAWHIPSLT